MHLMISLKEHIWSALAVSIFLAPGGATAQPVASSFEELRRVLMKGQTVVVTEPSGQRTTGRVADLSPFSLVVVVPQDPPRTFAEGTVTEIRRPDTLGNGALTGLAVGAGASIPLISAMCADGPDCGPWLHTAAVSAGIGAAIGAGIDALLKGGGVLYRWPRRTSRLTLSPLVGTDRPGVLVSVRF
jgi:hypothetical protein